MILTTIDYEKIVDKYNNGLSLTKSERKIFYDNDINLLSKYASKKILTKEELICFSNYRIDIVRFASEVLNIKLVDFQIELILGIKDNKKILIKSSRQTGISTLMAIVYIHDIIFNQYDNKIIFEIYNNKKLCSVAFINKVKLLYIKLPFYLKPTVSSWGAERISFDNRNITFTTNVYRKVKGAENNYVKNNDSIYKVLMDDFNPSNIKLKDIYDISNIAESFCIVGFNGELINDIEEESHDRHPNYNNFRAFKTYWFDVANRDIEWKNKTIIDIGSKEKFLLEYSNRVV